MKNILSNNLIYHDPQFPGAISGWYGHIPFAYFLIDQLKPKQLVELGSHYGTSYFAFCEAIKHSNLKCSTYAIDTWKGDKHSGFYGKEIFDYVSRINNKNFSSFSNLLKMTFNEALNYFEDNSIDLLHIDGLHTYEAVKRDFEQWLPKLSDRGVILLHDTQVKDKNFGVWKLWDEIKDSYPSIEFKHSYGLGLICTGKNIDASFLNFISQFKEDEHAALLFEKLGERITNAADNKRLTTNNSRLSSYNIKLQEHIENIDKDREKLLKIINDQTHKINQIETQIEEKVEQIESLIESNSLNAKLIKDKEETIKNHQETIHQLKLQEQSLQFKINKLNKSLQHFSNSLSWRITLPIRLLSISYLKRKKQEFAHLKLLKKSPYFNEKFYIQNNSDLVKNKVNAAKHYLHFGGFEGRDPSLDFNSEYYLQQNQDVIESGLNPLIHFIKYGQKEGRKPHAENIFSPNIASTDLQQLKDSGLFNASYYLRSNNDVATAGIDPLEHFYYNGGAEGRNPSEEFNTYYYLKANPEAGKSGINPLIHYIKFGKKLGYLKKPVIINEEECAQNADISDILIPNEKYKTLKIAVFFHLYYLDLTEEFIGYLKNITIDFDLYISTPLLLSDNIKSLIEEGIPNANCTYVHVENLGRDIKPFLNLLDRYADNYDVICKIHTKKSKHNYNLLHWKKYLLDQLLGNSMTIKTILSEFEQNPNTGLIWPVTYPYLKAIGMDSGWGSHWSRDKNFSHAQKYFPELELNQVNENFEFPNGSMFWFRPKALEFLKKAMTSFIFEKENSQVDGTLAHSIERLIGIINEKAGFKSKKIFFKNKIIHSLENSSSLFPDRKRILFISHDLYRAGAQIVLLTSLQWLQKHTAYELIVLAIKRGNDGGKLLPEFEKCAQVIIWDEIKTLEGNQDKYSDIQHELGSVDLIYGNTIISASLYPELKKLNAPILTHVHELEESIRKYATAETLKNMHKYSNFFIADSKPVEENLIRNHQIDEAKLITIEEFIRTDHQKVDKKLTRTLLNLPQQKILIWGCGTIYWRKGTDIFIQTAKILKDRGLSNFHFYWIGENHWNADYEGYNKWEDWEEYIREHQLENFITFLGGKEYPKKYFNSGDIFFLSSREEPFGIVGLEAAEGGSPIVCFDNRGGMPYFVGDDAGIIIPELDEKLAADALEELISDDALRLQKGAHAKRKLHQFNTDDVALPQILSVFQKIMRKGPMVSIIVPFYNHEKYVKDRMESILNQTFRDYEIIILDDASTDSSLELLKPYKSHPAVTIIGNNENSGSGYSQWKKGVELAQGNYIWIAEGDDISDHTFLERLLPAFHDKNTCLTFCASNRIDANGKTHDPNYVQLGHYNQLNYPSERWESNYKSNGLDEILNALSIRCTIPNVSAVLFRAENLKNIDFSKSLSFKTAGDWYIYLSLLKNGDITYIADPLNHHRIHSLSVIAKNKQEAKNTLPDYYRIHHFIIENYAISEEVFNKMTQNVTKNLRYIWPELSESEFTTLYSYKELKKLYAKFNSSN